MAKGSGPTEVEGAGTGTGAATIADGADVAEGAIADAAATAGGTGTLSAKLRRVTSQLSGGLPAALNADGSLKVGAASGESASSFLSTNAVQATNAKASAGTITGYDFFKKSAGAVYGRLYDKASAPGTGDTPIWRFMVPGSTAGDAGGVVRTFLNGLGCTNGVGYRCTAAVADNDNTALTANDVMGNVGFI